LCLVACLAFVVLSFRIRLSSSQSTGDSGSDNSENSGNDSVNKIVPGSAVRAKKSAAAKELAEAQQQLETYVSVVSACVFFSVCK